MMLFCPEEEPGVRLRWYQQMMGWSELGISAGFLAEDKCSQSGFGLVPIAMKVKQYLQYCLSVVALTLNLYFTTSCPQGFGLRKNVQIFFYFL